VKAPSPVLGFNNNVKHKGRVFHIQTEDSGIRHPHVITHLFADGGRILKTTKTSYAEHVGDAALTETVRTLMKEQHKAMFIALRDGQYDHLIDEPAGGQAAKEAAAPPPPPPPAPSSVPKFAKPASAKGKDSPISSLLKGRSIPLPVVPPPAPSRPASSSSSALDALLKPKPQPPPSPIPPPPPSRGRPTFDLDQASIAPAARDMAPTAPIVRRATPLGTPATEAGLDLDLDALERAAAEAETPFFQQIQDLPPPPAAVVGRKPPPVPVPLRPPRPSPPGEPKSVPRPTTSPAIAAAALQPGTPSAGRYALSRPAAIFSASRPAEGSSIFGEDLISEKSLDEVILSYLAEDLDTPSEK
jgi:hypothetical protein